MNNHKNAFGQKPTAQFKIEIQTLTIGFWNDLDLEITLTLITILNHTWIIAKEFGV